MRGIHDSPILGTKSQAERIPLLEKIFCGPTRPYRKTRQPNVETVPQIFCPYKEVLADYRAGLKVPDDVTIVFPDDNFGYIRQFPTAEEQKRKGGFGVYYHISYLGRPLSYLWLNSTPPALIWQEMNKAYENGMRQLWIVNVGDIKPGEIGMEFFLQMAYDADRWTIENQHELFKTMGETRIRCQNAADAIADILDEYYRLGFQRKPEHLQWYLPTEPARASDLTDEEKLNRLDAYARLRETRRFTLRENARDKKGRVSISWSSIRSGPPHSLTNASLPPRSLAHTEQDRRQPVLNGPDDLSLPTRRSRLKQNTSTKLSPAENGVTSCHPRWIRANGTSMRSTPPKIALTEFGTSDDGPINIRPMRGLGGPSGGNSIDAVFSERKGVVSIEAENFQQSIRARRLCVEGDPRPRQNGRFCLGFPGSISNVYRPRSPVLEYQIDIENGRRIFTLTFILSRHSRSFPETAYDSHFPIDGGEPQNRDRR